MKNGEKLIAILFVSSLGFTAQADDRAQWADQRVNQHMIEIETKRYHLNKVNQMQNDNIMMRSEIENLQFDKKQEDLGSMGLEEQSYSVDGHSNDIYVESPIDEVSASAKRKYDEQQKREQMKRAYYQYLEKNLKESGVDYEYVYGDGE
ncbi:MAG: hypothetical protein VX642_08295 [Bdellovibrionota bacterium]|nr:hypothetical protein [Bdellovibrionota bacterium]